MKKRTRWVTWSAVAALLAGLSGSGPGVPEAPAPAALPARAPKPTPRAAGHHALLIGCTRYPNLDQPFQLTGPGNDVVLMRRLLTEHFGFDPANIVTLSEAAGRDRRPVRAHVEREFRRLAATVRPGDWVVVLLSGHGSQQPAPRALPPGVEAKPGGWRQTFLPADVGRWNGGKETVENAIIDYELARWVRGLTAQGAFVWGVVDSCHSGTLLRSADGDLARDVAPEDLGVPGMAPRVRDGGPGPSVLRADGEDALVALYAAQPGERTFERPFPLGAPNGQNYGFMTYALCEVLTRSRSPLTFQEVAERIRALYVRWALRSVPPVPFVEGRARGREVLGKRDFTGRSRFALEVAGAGPWKVNAGLFHGLTPGSVLAVYPPAGETDRDEKLGHVKVVKATTFEAEAEPCAYAGRDAPKALAPRRRPELGYRLEPVYLDHGSLRLRVMIGAVAEADRGPLRQALAELEKDEKAVVQLVEEPRRANWVVRDRDGGLVLTPAEAAGPAFALDRDNLAGDLRSRLDKIAAAQNLLAVAAAAGEAARDRATVKVKVEVVRLRDKDDRVGVPLDGRARGLCLAPGERIGFRLTNEGTVAADVTLLLVDAEYEVEAAYPRPGRQITRLPPGGEPLLVASGKVTRPRGAADDAVLLEHVLMIAVEGGGGPPVDFSCLAQPSERGAQEADVGKALDTPLGRLLRHALYTSGTTRGSRTTDNHQVRVLTWHLLPAVLKEGSMEQGRDRGSRP
jgi:hypothetical protein